MCIYIIIYKQIVNHLNTPVKLAPLNGQIVPSE